ncbi:MAG TPA: lytic transglycosylase domain-containing protein, partial [Rudaea sp.]|nr:lytic transglycosylase domain-containing protein [Rudaea sp.]
MRRLFVLTAIFAFLASSGVHARTVWRCVRDGTVSLSTAPEPGSRCVAKTLDDASPSVPDLLGSSGVRRGTLYRREQ